jgi:hypothetical protein
MKLWVIATIWGGPVPRGLPSVYAKYMIRRNLNESSAKHHSLEHLVENTQDGACRPLAFGLRTVGLWWPFLDTQSSNPYELQLAIVANKQRERQRSLMPDKQPLHTSFLTHILACLAAARLTRGSLDWPAVHYTSSRQPKGHHGHAPWFPQDPSAPSQIIFAIQTAGEADINPRSQFHFLSSTATMSVIKTCSPCLHRGRICDSNPDGCL